VVCDCFEKADKALREQHGAGIGWSVHAPTAGAVEFRPTIDADPDVRIGFFGGADGADYMERLRAILDRLEKSGV
jgi:hypothetical protein